MATARTGAAGTPSGGWRAGGARVAAAVLAWVLVSAPLPASVRAEEPGEPAWPEGFLARAFVFEGALFYEGKEVGIARYGALPARRSGRPAWEVFEDVQALIPGPGPGGTAQQLRVRGALSQDLELLELRSEEQVGADRRPSIRVTRQGDRLEIRRGDGAPSSLAADGPVAATVSGLLLRARGAAGRAGGAKCLFFSTIDLSLQEVALRVGPSSLDPGDRFETRRVRLGFPKEEVELRVRTSDWAILALDRPQRRIEVRRRDDLSLDGPVVLGPPPRPESAETWFATLIWAMWRGNLTRALSLFDPVAVLESSRARGYDACPGPQDVERRLDALLARGREDAPDSDAYVWMRALQVARTAPGYGETSRLVAGASLGAGPAGGTWRVTSVLWPEEVIFDARLPAIQPEIAALRFLMAGQWGDVAVFDACVDWASCAEARGAGGPQAAALLRQQMTDFVRGAARPSRRWSDVMQSAESWWRGLGVRAQGGRYGFSFEGRGQFWVGRTDGEWKVVALPRS